MAIIGPNSHEKFTKYEIRSSYYLLQFGFIYPYVAPKYHVCITYLRLSLFTYIWPNIALITLIWSYLPLIALILPYVPYSPQIDIPLLRLHICAKFESDRTIFMEILHFKELGDTESVVTNAVYVSNFNTNVPLGEIYPPIKLNSNVLGIDNAMPL